MDNFREWVSDNLRYIMLGGGILLLVVVVFFAVRTFSGDGKDGSAKSKKQSDTVSAGQQVSGDQVSGDQVSDNALEKDAIPEVNRLVQDYYKALGDKNIEELRSMVSGLDPAEESKIANMKYIEGYENVEVYTKKGLEEGSYVVFASFAYKCADVDTPAPALSQLYIITDESGKLWISGEALHDPEIQAYVSTVMDQSDVIQLRNNVQASYDQAQSSDPQLQAFLESLGGEDSGTPRPESTTSTSENDLDGRAADNVSTEGMMTALDDCNVRISAESGSEIVTVVPAGEQVSRLGEENGWVQIEYDGVTGYVYQDLLQ